MRIELITTRVTKPPTVPPAMAATFELVGRELVDAPGVVDVVEFELDEPIGLAESNNDVDLWCMSNEE